MPNPSFSRSCITLALLLAAGCDLRTRVAPETEAGMRKAWDQVLIESEPMCVEAGPFPFRADTRGNCDRCQALADAGLLARRVDAQGVVFELTEEGRSVYRLDPDPEHLDLIRERIAQTPNATMPELRYLQKPRLCFGRTRFHSVADALPPSSIDSNPYQSIKLVQSVEDTSGLLFDSRLQGLGLKTPPRPVPGQPALLAPRIVNFEYDRLSKVWFVNDSVRYGAWVDAD